MNTNIIENFSKVYNFNKDEIKTTSKKRWVHFMYLILILFFE